MQLGKQFGNIWQLLKAAVTAWVDDAAPSMGAALAYYTVFSIAPLLLLVIALAGLIFGVDAARGEIVAQLGGLMGKEGATAIEGLLKSASDTGDSVIAAVVSIVTLLIGATTVFAELQSDLDRIWKAPAAVKPAGVWGLIRTRFLSFGMILGIGFLLIVSLALSAALAALGKWWGGMFGNWEILLQAVNFAFSFAVITAMFALVYKIMPSVRIRWHDVWIGAAVTALLFTVGKFLIGLYLGKAGVASGFGAAGSLIVVLVWVYYSTQIFLLGAEFTYVYAHEAGSRAGEPQPAKGAGKTAPPDQRHDATPAPVSADGGLPRLHQPVQVMQDTREVAATANLAQSRALIKLAAALSAGWFVGYVATSRRATETGARVKRKAARGRAQILRTLIGLTRSFRLS